MITGRVADASLFLAPLVHEHGWAWDDWDRLSAGILVGHLLECSGQSLGGNYSGDWWALPHPWDLPYPIARVEADGTAVITKPTGSGGRVSTDTLRHQLLYEVHDPTRYLSPDVVADFTSAHFEDLPDDQVRITEVRGTPATDDLQVAARVPRRLGGRGARRVLVARRVREGEGHRRHFREAGGDGRARGRRVALRVLGCRRARRRRPFRDDPACEPPECVLRVAWRCDDQRTAGLVGRELVPLTLVGSARRVDRRGRGGGGGPTELLGIWPTLIDKALVDDHVRITIEEVH